MNNMFERFLDSHGIPYKIYRNGNLICEVEGLTQNESVDFRVGTDIEKGDIIINPANERLYVSSKETAFVHKEATHIVAHTVSEAEYNRTQTSNNPVFNIGNVSNSIVGTQQNATIFNGASIEDLRDLISQNNSLDKELLNEMVDLIEKELSSNKPIKRGVLSKFAGILQNNEWITSPLAAFMLEHFFLQ